MILFITCQKLDIKREIKIETDSIVFNITSTSAEVKGNILDFGDNEIINHGHCWSTIDNPTIRDSRTNLGDTNSRGVFVGYLSSLNPNTKYYVRAYVTDAQDTIYGNQVSFTSAKATNICDEPADFCDDFSNSDLAGNWILSGYPLPVWIDTIFGRSGLFDNNGDGMYASNAYSKMTIAGSEGFSLEAEIYLNVTDTAGCWLDASIGLTKQENPMQSDIDLDAGLLFGLVYSGQMCWATPDEYNNHVFLDIYVFAEDSTASSPGNMVFYADGKENGWHTLKITVQPDRFVKFYLDNSLIWISSKRIHPDLLMNKNILLGRRSSGIAGKAYIDWIKYTENKSTVETDTSHEFYISSNNAWIEMMVQPNYTYTFNNHNYTVAFIDNSKISVMQDSSISDEILSQFAKEYNESSDVLINEFCSTNDAFISFGSSSTNYVTFISSNITCFPGDEITFIGNCSAQVFEYTDPDIYENTIVEDWFINTSLSNGNYTASWKFKIPSGASPGTYNFKFGARFSANARFVRPLVITVISH